MEKRSEVKRFKEKKARQQPTFPPKGSIIGVRELDFRVRNGNGYNLSTMATGQYSQNNRICIGDGLYTVRQHIRETKQILNENDNMVKPHDLLVLLG